MTVYQTLQNNNKFIKPSGWMQIRTIDMHTCGEPLRVILDGFPELGEKGVLSCRRELRDKFDYLRTALMHEPRGHADMYGCLLVPPNDEDGDLGVIFMHNEGYSTMCGHAVIALATLAVEMNWIQVKEGENELRIDAPCGRIHAFTRVEGGSVSGVRFHGVPSFVAGLDRKVQVPGLGEVIYDLAYGGAFYAYVDLNKNSLPIDLSVSSYRHLIRAGMKIKEAVRISSREIVHPFEEDLSFLYGTIFIGDSSRDEIDSRNVCIFADGEVDRCPTGSGISGRMAIHHARQELEPGRRMSIESIIDTVFLGSIVREVEFGPYLAVIPEVEGSAHITGQHTFYLDPKDPLREGFFLR